MAGLTADKVGSLTVLVLREELKKAGLDSRGNKAALVERLKGHVESTGDTGDTVNEKEEEKKAEPVAAAVVPAAADVEKKAEEPKEAGNTEKKETDKEDNNPLSEERMKRRAERFGLPWPREEGAKRPKLSAKGGIKKKENAISAFVLTSEEINQREARAKRFASSTTEGSNGTNGAAAAASK